MADPDLELSGGAVLIYLPWRPFSFQSFLLFLPKIRGGGGGGRASPRSATGTHTIASKLTNITIKMHSTVVIWSFKQAPLQIGHSICFHERPITMPTEKIARHTVTILKGNRRLRLLCLNDVFPVTCSVLMPEVKLTKGGNTRR